VPFRLTPALHEALAPLDRTQLLTTDIGLALAALHAARAPLAAAMEVFAREPLVDWNREAHIAASAAGAASAADASTSHTARRLALARRKLVRAMFVKRCCAHCAVCLC
jgi:hypothetical protein